VSAVGERAWRRLDARAGLLGPDELKRLSPILVIAPHPDDETLGCGGLLTLASRLGLLPRVIYLTDGRASHLGSPAWPPRRLAKERRREALAALAELGVGRTNVLFLDWRDAAPHPRGSPGQLAAVEKVSRWLFDVSPRSIFAPWRGEEHCDHQAAAELAIALAERLPLRQLDYMVWGWSLPHLEAAHGSDVCWRLPCADACAERRRALARHRTQMTDLISDAEEAFRIPEELVALTDRSSEIFFERG